MSELFRLLGETEQSVPELVGTAIAWLCDISGAGLRGTTVTGAASLLERVSEYRVHVSIRVHYFHTIFTHMCTVCMLSLLHY